ncbi:CPBP family intramembrane metalloprotease [Clostridium sp. MSJ-11]|uniref:CPBP family intramembrane metalloprotease n=2 Tax=Clostridium mobile TaxID=2841512 RepID=A0ABS6EJT7_9CLOT|nr:CPBP family intramembrane metalloprotease [Clostridium mobile]
MFWNFWTRKGRNKFLLFIISIIYLALSLFTQNLLPFILVLICIKYIKEEWEDDYYSYGFNLNNFKLLKAIKYSIFSYICTMIIGMIALIIFDSFKISIKEQEVITRMTELPLKRYIINMPIIVIFAPVVEEFIFRWLFFEKIFKDRIGIYISAILTSLIFSMVHFNLMSFPSIFWIGLFNCYLIHKHGYWYAVFNHGFFNSISAFVLLFQKLV